MTHLASPYRLVFFDNDGTLNSRRSFVEYFNQHFGTWDSRARSLLEHHLRDRTPYDEFVRECVGLWTGVPKERFLERLRTIEIRPGAPELLRALKSARVKTAVLSSGLTLWRDMWLERENIAFDHYHANELIFDSDDLCTGEIEMHVTDNIPGMDKGSWVERISALEGVSIEQRVFVGDGWGDVSGFRRCAFGVAVDPNLEEVRLGARYVLGPDEFSKLHEILLPSRARYPRPERK